MPHDSDAARGISTKGVVGQVLRAHCTTTNLHRCVRCTPVAVETTNEDGDALLVLLGKNALGTVNRISPV